MVKAVIFDLDGTLCNTVEDLKTAINATLAKLGYRQRSLNDVIKYIGNGSKEFVKRSLPKDVQDIDFIFETALEVYNNEYRKHYNEKTVPYEGVKSMLMSLKGMGYKLGVLSNKQDEFVNDIINTHFGKDLFNVVMGNADLPPKPDPAVAIAVAKQLKIRPSRCVLVGDSDVDVTTSINAGMQIIGVDWGYREEEVLRQAGALNIAHKPEEIVEIIKRFDS